MGHGIFRDEDGNYNKRLVGLLLLILFVVIGAGVGTIGLTSDDPAPGRPAIEMTPVPAEATVTPTPAGTDPSQPETPTESGGSGSPPPSDLVNATPTPTPTPILSDSRPDDGDTSETTEEPSDNVGGSSGSGGGSSSSGGGSSGGSGGSAGGGGDSGSSGNLSLETQGSAVLLQVGELAPGDTESGSVVVQNSGSDAGTLGVADVNVSDDENGLREPERVLGDTAATGELSDHLEVKLWVTYANGTTEYLAGSDTSSVTLATLDGASEQGTRAVAGGEQATVEIEVTLPESTGNEVQSDRVDITVPIVLQQLRS
ncbi:hypothetical protein [Haloarcula japonica]|uniref:Uncharacterized protein n=1 Tax=Haloarcula japonica (strain ATCC 49778 / DSM 6131 / JCM 7785 / NBRC 101032 / NCIMB 13157 / TR-1) TaxID=1227453 RepID=M0LHA2_HALJT|nr:hypothetical protein [Haloarcula japonica]EMA32906.1 hypothetical protein C444_06776 [Haloarcula japonica DSM 6131]